MDTQNIVSSHVILNTSVQSISFGPHQGNQPAIQFLGGWLFLCCSVTACPETACPETACPATGEEGPWEVGQELLGVELLDEWDVEFGAPGEAVQNAAVEEMGLAEIQGPMDWMLLREQVSVSSGLGFSSE